MQVCTINIVFPFYFFDVLTNQVTGILKVHCNIWPRESTLCWQWAIVLAETSPCVVKFRSRGFRDRLAKQTPAPWLWLHYQLQLGFNYHLAGWSRLGLSSFVQGGRVRLATRRPARIMIAFTASPFTTITQLPCNIIEYV